MKPIAANFAAQSVLENAILLAPKFFGHVEITKFQQNEIVIDVSVVTEVLRLTLKDRVLPKSRTSVMNPRARELFENWMDGFTNTAIKLQAGERFQPTMLTTTAEKNKMNKSLFNALADGWHNNPVTTLLEATQDIPNADDF